MHIFASSAWIGLTDPKISKQDFKTKILSPSIHLHLSLPGAYICSSLYPQWQQLQQDMYQQHMHHQSATAIILRSTLHVLFHMLQPVFEAAALCFGQDTKFGGAHMCLELHLCFMLEHCDEPHLQQLCGITSRLETDLS
eukprot:833547-Pelagomonas_calceolata.AAC.2